MDLPSEMDIASRYLTPEPMRVIPVIDLLQGQVVRGIAGKRSEYAPVESCLAGDASPASIAAAFASQFGFHTVYVADLDAIVHGRPDYDNWQRIAAAGLELWLDAGIGSLAAAQEVFEQARQRRFSPRLVIGLESLESPAELAAICRHAQRPIFSLDLKAGRVQLKYAAWQDLPPAAVAAAAYECGTREIIVLDLADVGLGKGTRTLDLCHEIRTTLPLEQLIAGGGVRSKDDLAALASAGCDAALVASALHDGRLTPEQLRDVNFLTR